MKVLCPIDFSEVSLNAAKWIAHLLHKVNDGELHLCHFIHFNRRANMFMSLDKIFRERAQEDMAELVTFLNSKYPELHISQKTYMAHPKEGTIHIANKGKYDLIVTGTSGLNAIKDMTIGSVTQYIFNHSDVPILAIPGIAISKTISKIGLAVDDKMLKKLGLVTFLRDLSISLNATIHVVHITEEGESPFEYDPAIDMIFKKIDFAYDRIPFEDSFSHTLNKYCRKNSIDMLCMIKHKRKWFKKLLTKSVTKSKLFELQLPLLVLNDK